MGPMPIARGSNTSCAAWRTWMWHSHRSGFCLLRLDTDKLAIEDAVGHALHDMILVRIQFARPPDPSPVTRRVIGFQPLTYRFFGVAGLPGDICNAHTQGTFVTYVHDFHILDQDSPAPPPGQ